MQALARLSRAAFERRRCNGNSEILKAVSLKPWLDPTPEAVHFLWQGTSDIMDHVKRVRMGTPNSERQEYSRNIREYAYYIPTIFLGVPVWGSH